MFLAHSCAVFSPLRCGRVLQVCGGLHLLQPGQVRPATVLYCTILHCTALYYTALYCTALYCTVLNCTVLYCTVLYCTVLYCTVLYCTPLGTWPTASRCLHQQQGSRILCNIGHQHLNILILIQYNSAIIKSE